MFEIVDKNPAWVGQWMQEKGCGPYREGATCIGLTRFTKLVAATSYDNFNGASIVASIAIDGPITKKWLWWIFAYPFMQLNARIILGLISSANLKSLHLVERMGFTSVAKIPDADPSGSLCLYALHKDDCRFLKGRHS